LYKLKGAENLSPPRLQSLVESKSVGNAPRSINYTERYNELNLTEPSLVLDSFLFLGGHWTYTNTDLLTYLGITHVLNLARELPVPRNFNKNTKLKIRHIKAIDSETYYLRNDFDEAFSFIDKARESGGRILVNCVMGVSRSATIVIGYLMSRYTERWIIFFNKARNGKG